MATVSESLVSRIAALQDYKRYDDLHWEGSFEDYLRIVRERPAGHAQRVPAPLRHDHQLRRRGVHRQQEEARPLQVLPGPIDNGKDAIFGLDIPLMRLVHVLKAAAQGYGPEKRVILLHGPVGSSKSTIARLLKKGIEHYSRTPEGALYTFNWVEPRRAPAARRRRRRTRFPCPMHEEPLRLIPSEWRDSAIARARASQRPATACKIDGDLDPACRFIFQRLMRQLRRRLGQGDRQPRARAAPAAVARRTASASAPSSRRTRRTRTRPSSPATSTTARSPSTARTPIRARSTSTASSTSPTAASSSSSRC